MYNLEDVFVPVGFPEITYYDRTYLTDKFTIAKMNKCKHICLYGSSKSGKSNLWRKNLKPNEYVKIGINFSDNINTMYKKILDELNAFYTSEIKHEEGSSESIAAEVKGTIKTILASLSSNITASAKSTDNISKSEEKIVRPLISPETIVKFLKISKKRVIIEDFHYANDNLIRIFSQDLKVFSDEGCQFILVSIPCYSQYLIRENRELQTRLTDIPVEMFKDKELFWIINKGSDALNVVFSDDIIDNILEEAKGNASIVQNICQMICYICNVRQTSKKQVIIDKKSYFEQACKNVAESEKSCYQQIIDTITVHKHGNDRTNVYKWILRVIKETQISENGISNTEMLHRIVKLGNKEIKQGSVTFGLGHFQNLLSKNKLPLFFEYDENKTFYVRDEYMAFVFKWLPKMITKLFQEQDKK